MASPVRIGSPTSFGSAGPTAFGKPGPTSFYRDNTKLYDDSVYDNRDELDKAITRSGENASAAFQATGGQLLEPFAPEFARSQIQNALNTTAFSSRRNKPSIGTIYDAKSAQDWVNLGLGTLGEQAINAPLAIGGTLVGAAAGMPWLGGALTMFPQEMGGIVQDVHSDAKVMAKTTPWQRLGATAAGGAVAAGLEAMPEAGIIGKLLSPAKKMGPGVMGKALGAGDYLAKSMLGEFITEMPQDAVAQLTPMALGNEKSFDSAQMFDAGVKGAIGGAAFGAGAGTAAVAKDAFSLGIDHKFDGLVPPEIRAKGDQASMDYLNSQNTSARGAVETRINDIVSNPNVSESQKAMFEAHRENLDTQEGRDLAAKDIIAHETGTTIGKTLHNIIKPVLDKFSFSEDFPGVISTKEEKDAHLEKLKSQTLPGKYDNWKPSGGPFVTIDGIKLDHYGISTPAEVEAAIKEHHPDLKEKDVAGYQKSLFELNELFDVFNLNKSDEEWNSMKAVLIANPEAQVEGKNLDTQMWDKPQTKEARARVLNELFDVAETKEQKRVVNEYADRMGVKLTPGSFHIIQSYFDPNGSTDKTNAAVGKRTPEQADAQQASFDELNSIKNHFMEERSGVAEHRKARFAKAKALLESAIGKDAYKKLSIELNDHAVKNGEGFAVYGKEEEIETVVQHDGTPPESSLSQISEVENKKHSYDKVVEGSNQQKLYSELDRRADLRKVSDIDPKLSDGMQMESDAAPIKDWAEERMNFSSAILAAKDEDGNQPSPQELNTLMNAVSGVSTGMGSLVEKSEKEADAPEWSPPESGEAFNSAVEKYRALHQADARNTKAAGEKKKVHTVELADHENVKALFDKFGLDFKKFIGYAERNFVERRKSEAGNEGEFQASDLPLLALDKNQEFITDDKGNLILDKNGDPIASKLTLLMEDANGKEVRINAHVLTSAMAKMNMTLDVDPNTSYENRIKQTFLQAYAALTTQLGVTQKHTSLEPKNLFTEKVKIFSRKNEDGTWTSVTNKEVPDEVFLASVSEGATPPAGWNWTTEPRKFPMFDGGLVPSRGLTDEDLKIYAIANEIDGVTWELHPNTTIKNLAGGKIIRATGLMRQSATQTNQDEAMQDTDLTLAEAGFDLNASIHDLQKVLDKLIESRDSPDIGQAISAWEDERASVLAQISEMHERMQAYRDEIGGEGSDDDVEYMIPDWVFETPKVNMDGSYKSGRERITISEDFKSEKEKAKWIAAGKPVKTTRFKTTKDLSAIYSKYPVAQASRLAFMDSKDAPVSGKFDELGKSLRKVLRAAARLKGMHNAPLQDDYKTAKDVSAAFALHSNLELLGMAIKDVNFSFPARAVFHQYGREIMRDALARADVIFSNNKLTSEEKLRRSVKLGKELKGMADVLSEDPTNSTLLAIELRDMATDIRDRTTSYSEDAAPARLDREQKKQLAALIDMGPKGIERFISLNPDSVLIPHLAGFGVDIKRPTKVGKTHLEDSMIRDHEKATKKANKLSANEKNITPRLNTLAGVWANRYGVTGNIEIRVVDIVEGREGRQGSYQPTENGHIITLKRSLFASEMDVTSIFAHEFGHAILNNIFEVHGGVDIEAQRAALKAKSKELYAAYERYYKDVTDNKNLTKSRNPRTQGQKIDPTKVGGKELETYISPAEWMAEQFARYAMDPNSEESQAYPKSVKELFNAAMIRIKEFFASLKEQGVVGATYDVPKEFSDFLAKLREEVATKEAPIQEQQASTEYKVGELFVDGTSEDDYRNYTQNIREVITFGDHTVLIVRQDITYKDGSRPDKQFGIIIPEVNKTIGRWHDKLQDAKDEWKHRSTAEGFTEKFNENIAKHLADKPKAVEVVKKEAPTVSNQPVNGDIWEQEGVKIVSVNKGGVHGAGLAKQAEQKGLITRQKNRGFAESPFDKGVITIAVKGNAPETRMPGKAAWSEKVTGGNVDLLRSEIDKLIEYARQHPDTQFNLPYVGLGFGEGDAATILPILENATKEPNIRLISATKETFETHKATVTNKARTDKRAERLLNQPTQDDTLQESENVPPPIGEVAPPPVAAQEEAPAVEEPTDSYVLNGKTYGNKKADIVAAEKLETIMNAFNAGSINGLKNLLKAAEHAAIVPEGVRRPGYLADTIAREIATIQKALATLEALSPDELARMQYVGKQKNGPRMSPKDEHAKYNNLAFTDAEIEEFATADELAMYSQQAAMGGGPTVPPNNPMDSENSAESDPKILKYLQKILGKKVKLLIDTYPDFMSSYELEDGDIHSVKLSNVAGLGSRGDAIAARLNMFKGLDPAGNAAHAAFIGSYAKTANTETRNALAKFALQPHVMGQLKILLAKHPDALKQAQTSMEARLAYVFMFYENGQFNVKQPVVKNWFNRIIQFVRDVFHILSADEKAAKIFDAIRVGKMADISQKKMDDFYRALGLRSSIDQFFANHKVANAFKDSVWQTFTGQAERAGNSGSLVIDRLRRQLKQNPGEEGSEGFVQAKERMSGVFSNRFKKFTVGWTMKELDAQMVKIRKGEAPIDERESKLHDDIADLFDDLYKYMETKGVKKGSYNELGILEWKDLKARSDYRMPQSWNSEAIVKNKEGFVDFLMTLDGFTEEKARGVAENLATGTNSGMTEVMQNLFEADLTPAMTAINERQIFIPDDKQEAAAEFLKGNMLEVVEGYIRQTTHRAEFAERFGNDGNKITAAIEEARAEGIASEMEIEDTITLFRAVEGTLGQDISENFRLFNNTAITAINWMVLGLSLFTSLVDSVGVAVKTGNLNDAFTVFGSGVKALLGQVDKTEGYKIASLLGIMAESNTNMLVGNMYGSQMGGSWQAKANDLLFKINGMNAWNNGMRAGATAIAARWIAYNRENVDKLAAEGIDASKVNWDLKDAEFFQQEEIAQGMFRLVDEMVLRPDATQRPGWGSDPHFAIFWHLKQFTWSFNQMILKPSLARAEQGDMTGLYMMAAYVPGMMMADFVKGLVQGGGEEPEWKKKLTFMDRVGMGVVRSGVLGIGGMAIEATMDANSGKPTGMGLLGPTTGVTYDTLDRAIDIATPDPDDKYTAMEKSIQLIEHILPFNNLYRNWDTFSVRPDADEK